MYQITNQFAFVRFFIILRLSFGKFIFPPPFMSTSLTQLTAMLDLGELGQLALPPADWEAKTGRGKDDFKTLNVLVILIFITGQTLRMRKTTGKSVQS